MFYEIVRKLPEGAQIVIEGSGDRAVLSLRAGRSRFTLQTLPESDFPDLAAGEMSHSFKVAAADLKRLIDKTQFAISTEETRYYLNGIYLHTAGSAKSGTLRAVATDGHRLAQVELPLPQGANGMKRIERDAARQTLAGIESEKNLMHVDVAVSCDQDNGRCQSFALHAVHQVETGHSRHPHIGNDAVEPLAAINRGQKILRRCKARGLDVLASEIETQRVEHGLVVVDDSNVD